MDTYPSAGKIFQLLRITNNATEMQVLCHCCIKDLSKWLWNSEQNETGMMDMDSEEWRLKKLWLWQEFYHDQKNFLLPILHWLC